MKVHDLKPAPGSKPKKQPGRPRHRRPAAARRPVPGTKGQGTRGKGKIPPEFEGGQTPLSRRTPKLKGFKNPFRIEYTVINLDHPRRRSTPATEVDARDAPGQGPRPQARPGQGARPGRDHQGR